MKMTTGQFIWGTGLGLMAGAALGMTLASSRREIKRAAHKAVKNVNSAVDQAMDSLTQAMSM